MIHATLTAQRNHQKRMEHLDAPHALTATIHAPTGMVSARVTTGTRNIPDLVTVMLQSKTTTSVLYHGTLDHYQPREPRIHITVRSGIVQAVTVNGEECAYSLTDYDGTDQDDRIEADISQYRKARP